MGAVGNFWDDRLEIRGMIQIGTGQLKIKKNKDRMEH